MLRTRQAIIILAIVCTAFTPVGPARGEMSAEAPPGPNTRIVTPIEVATSPAFPNVLFVRRISGGVELPPVYSLDGGKQWSEFPTIPWDITAVQSMRIAIVPRVDNSLRFIVITEEANNIYVYRTGDFGRVWGKEALPGFLGGGEVTLHALATSRIDPQRIYVLVSTYSGGYPFPSMMGFMFTSSDAGITWQNSGAMLDLYWSAIVVSPTVAGRIYLFVNGYDVGWYPSGASQEKAALARFPVSGLAVDSLDAQWLYGIKNGLSYAINGYSNDGGSNWQPFAAPPCETGQIFAHTGKTGFVYIVCSDGLYRSKDHGGTWQKLNSFPGGTLVGHYGTPAELLCHREGGLWHSTDDGTTWTELAGFSEFGKIHLYIPLVQK